jgi:hypothetical protein
LKPAFRIDKTSANFALTKLRDEMHAPLARRYAVRAHFFADEHPLTGRNGHNHPTGSFGRVADVSRTFHFRLTTRIFLHELHPPGPLRLTGRGNGLRQ